MKKKSLKKLTVKSVTISNLESNAVKGAGTYNCFFWWLYSAKFHCFEDPVTSDACLDTQNDDTCQCTIA
ncbi:hypothetical protein [Kordia sp.]|uniref:hypothetical protein n=1 Tax=Kordia sp. TaxID=1965332 RepID=UPI003D2E8F42